MPKFTKVSITLLTAVSLGTVATIPANATTWHKGLPTGLKGTWVSNKRYKIHDGNGHFHWRVWATSKEFTVVASKHAPRIGTPSHVKYRILPHHKYKILSYIKQDHHGEANIIYYYKGHLTINPNTFDKFPLAKMHKISVKPFK